MSENSDQAGSEKLDFWIKENLNAAVKKVMEKDLINSPAIEAKPAWVLPFQILVGKVRGAENQGEFIWFICGEVPTDYIESSVAKTPREAARHFTMKWQLTASKYQGENTTDNPTQLKHDDVVNHLIEQAQALYEVVEDERLWPTKS